MVSSLLVPVSQGARPSRCELCFGAVPLCPKFSLRWFFPFRVSGRTPAVPLVSKEANRSNSCYQEKDVPSSFLRENLRARCLECGFLFCFPFQSFRLALLRNYCFKALPPYLSRIFFSFRIRPAPALLFRLRSFPLPLTVRISAFMPRERECKHWSWTDVKFFIVSPIASVLSRPLKLCFPLLALPTLMSSSQQ